MGNASSIGHAADHVLRYRRSFLCQYLFHRGHGLHRGLVGRRHLPGTFFQQGSTQGLPWHHRSWCFPGLLRVLACNPAIQVAYSSSTREALKFIHAEEHTSELQSRFDLVCRLLLEKKKMKITPV